MINGRVTIQHVLDKLAKGFGSAQINNGKLALVNDSSCFIAAAEMNVFLEASDVSFYSIMNDLWDGGNVPIEYGTRTKGSVIINKPCPTLLGGITPGQLAKAMPSSSIYGGFTRRTNFVYSNDSGARIPFPPKVPFINQKLVNDLRSMSQLIGEFTFTPSALKLFEEYYMRDMIDEFDDEISQSYATTKWVHATKVAMSLCCARSDDLTIIDDDFKQATSLVDICSEDLQKVFRAVGDSELVTATDKVLQYIESKPACVRSEIMQRCWRDVGSTQVLDVILATLESGNLITTMQVGMRTIYKFNPKGQRGQP